MSVPALLHGVETVVIGGYKRFSIDDDPVADVIRAGRALIAGYAMQGQMVAGFIFAPLMGSAGGGGMLALLPFAALQENRLTPQEQKDFDRVKTAQHEFLRRHQQ